MDLSNLSTTSSEDLRIWLIQNKKHRPTLTHPGISQGKFECNSISPEGTGDVVKTRRERHMVLKNVLGERLGCKAEDLSINRLNGGKPWIERNNVPINLEISFTHSYSWIGIINSRSTPVGIDIEKIRANIRTESLINRFYTKEEKSYLDSYDLKEKIEKFYQLWTIKEALGKGLGDGLFCYTHQVSGLPALDGGSHILWESKDYEFQAPWRAELIEIGEEYAGAVAYRHQTVLGKSISRSDD